MNWKFSDYSKRCYSHKWWSEYIGDKLFVNLSSNTQVCKRNKGLVEFYLHNHCIIKLSWQNYWWLSSCGWETSLTKKRLNQLGPINIYQKDWQWMYTDDMGITNTFTDGIIVDCYGRQQDELCWTKLKL